MDPPRSQGRIRVVKPLTLALAAGLALLLLGTASAKDFRPGDLRVCNARKCVAIVDRAVLPTLGSFYYGGPAPATKAAPRLGSPYFELRFRNAYVTGIVATRRLDRFLSYGVHLERFSRGRWYAVPGKLARELRRLTAGLSPLHLTRSALAKSR
jgi:hypothetical protein